ncbi:MaoC family dehydratase N-terminal domain-containing protein [Bacillus sp. V5-8f]|uniref:FAS1-like dehydratase domain-containing protein n=1 Tax=Bacillus sp. V5-8f TaxID=2053044 RepID=UPI000C765F7E|nr:MaoC family dehydratase N-terminal domain-containing protein [Bacillus sp. V5-8f]PLT32094.1 hypothetical protein CUU64_21250 [Bacillus sp. V5-8f]
MKDWKEEWKPLIQAVGTNFNEDTKLWGADHVERGSIRQFLEPLEFDCALHYDKAVANENGYSDIVSPYSSLFTWIIPPYWKPGMDVFTSAERNAPATELPLLVVKTDLAPPTPFYFATNVEVDYIKPVIIGDRLCRAGDVLLSCVPKETKVGRGAFQIWETKIQNQKGQLVAKIRLETYHYFPHE